MVIVAVLYSTGNSSHLTNIVVNKHKTQQNLLMEAFGKVQRRRYPVKLKSANSTTTRCTKTAGLRWAGVTVIFNIMGRHFTLRCRNHRRQSSFALTTGCGTFRRLAAKRLI